MAAQQKRKQVVRDVSGIPSIKDRASDVVSGRGGYTRDRSPQVVNLRKPYPKNQRKSEKNLHSRPLKIGTWNVRTMNVKGKLENIKEEMRRNGLNVLGLSEVRWKESGDFESDDYRVVY